MSLDSIRTPFLTNKKHEPQTSQLLHFMLNNLMLFSPLVPFRLKQSFVFTTFLQKRGKLYLNSRELSWNTNGLHNNNDMIIITMFTQGNLFNTRSAVINEGPITITATYYNQSRRL